MRGLWGVILSEKYGCRQVFETTVMMQVRQSIREPSAVARDA